MNGDCTCFKASAVVFHYNVKVYGKVESTITPANEFVMEMTTNRGIELTVDYLSILLLDYPIGKKNPFEYFSKSGDPLLPPRCVIYIDSEVPLLGGSIIPVWYHQVLGFDYRLINSAFALNSLGGNIIFV
jgi:hypothetical protein